MIDPPDLDQTSWIIHLFTPSKYARAKITFTKPLEQFGFFM